MKHSKLGLASCLLAIATFGFATILVGASYFVSSVTEDRQQIGAVWIIADSSLLLLLIPLHIVGLILGVIGLFMRAKKIFPIIGTLLNLFLGIGSIWPWLYLLWHAAGRVQ